MPPKKKGGKKANDDWDAGLGESPTPQPDAGAASQDGNNDQNDASGGLMALMRKNKEKRKKKGITDDFVQGENPPGMEPPADTSADKAPQEASLDDEFALPDKKNKGNQKNKQPQKAADEDTGASGRILTKAEKEKLKKEREKQRKKEQVRQDSSDSNVECA